MKLKTLVADQFTVAAVVTGDECHAENFITEGEATYEASREGLANLLLRVATNGLRSLTSKHTHEADKQNKIYELIKGDLRLFYFKGEGNVVVVCTTGVIKKGQKVDKQAVATAIELQKSYKIAMLSSEIEWIEAEEI